MTKKAFLSFNYKQDVRRVVKAMGEGSGHDLHTYRPGRDRQQFGSLSKGEAVASLKRSVAATRRLLHMFAALRREQARTCL